MKEHIDDDIVPEMETEIGTETATSTTTDGVDEERKVAEDSIVLSKGEEREN